MYFPCRGGVRGGADQFNWEDIKTDKFRENYLGHSLKAPVGRWQKGKDLQWYSKDKAGSAEAKESMRALKSAEDEAMLAALGHKAVKKETGQVTKEELSEVLKRGQLERSGLDIERVEGMGYSEARSGSRAVKDGLMFHKSSLANDDVQPLKLEDNYRRDYKKSSLTIIEDKSNDNKSSKNSGDRRKRQRHDSDSLSEGDTDHCRNSRKLDSTSSKHKRKEHNRNRESERSHRKHKSDKRRRSRSSERKRKDEKNRHKHSKKKKKVKDKKHCDTSDSDS